jgi:hypothetical protein
MALQSGCCGFSLSYAAAESCLGSMQEGQISSISQKVGMLSQAVCERLAEVNRLEAELSACDKRSKQRPAGTPAMQDVDDQLRETASRRHRVAGVPQLDQQPSTAVSGQGHGSTAAVLASQLAFERDEAQAAAGRAHQRALAAEVRLRLMIASLCDCCPLQIMRFAVWRLLAQTGQPQHCICHPLVCYGHWRVVRWAPPNTH